MLSYSNFVLVSDCVQSVPIINVPMCNVMILITLLNVYRLQYGYSVLASAEQKNWFPSIGNGCNLNDV